MTDFVLLLIAAFGGLFIGAVEGIEWANKKAHENRMTYHSTLTVAAAEKVCKEIVK